ncbi:DUF448 domain-containing protein [bacterium]|nr:DUF448 domain-containing protein [bacterium]
MAAARTGHIPERTCRACRKKFPKLALHRWVVIDGVAVPDPQKNKGGRGWYACDEPSCQAKISQIAVGQARSLQRRKQGN